MGKLASSVLMALAMMFATAARAALIASDSFANTAGGADYAVGSLGSTENEGATVGTFGYSASQIWATTTGAIYNQTGGLTHALTTGTPLDGKVVAFSGTGSAGRAQRRQLNYTASTGSYYLSALFQKTTATTSFDLLTGVTSAIGASNGSYATTTGADLMMGIYNGTFAVANGSGYTTLLSDANFTVNETFFAVMQINFSTTDVDSATVTVYNGSSTQVASQTFTGLNLDGKLSHFAFTTNDYSPDVSIDELRYGTQLSDVMIPEPSVTLLGGLGVFLLLRRRR